MSRTGIRSLLLLLLVLPVIGATNNSIVNGLYRIESRLIMPNLAENLRYARQAESHCLQSESLPTLQYSLLLPILRHVSLTDCQLQPYRIQPKSIDLNLLCQGEKSATGVARIYVTGDLIRSNLDVRMGGKNMTFSQNSTAVRQSDCKS